MQSPYVTLLQSAARAYERSDPYTHAPLAVLSGKTRGEILERVVRRHDELEGHPAGRFEDALAGLCVNGSKRGRARALYDYARDGVRVEVKSARLIRRRDRWNVAFEGVKGDAHDELRLALYAPNGVRVFLHDGASGTTSSGVAQRHRGHSVQFYGPRGVLDWNEALAAIGAKMEHMHVATIAFNNSAYADLFAQPPPRMARVYGGAVLARVSPQFRGKILETFARLHDARQHHPGATFNDAARGHCVNGVRRGPHATAYDYARNGTRVEVKSAQLTYDTSLKLWHALFQNIKAIAHDELRLVLYTPDAIDVFVHDGTTGVVRAGKKQSACGGNVVVRSTRGEEDWSRARAQIRRKWAAMHVGTVALAT